MSLAQGSKLDNLVRSLYAFIETNYTETPFYLSSATDHDTISENEWVEFRLDAYLRQFLRDVDSRKVGIRISSYLTAEIQVKPTDDLMRIYRIRDVVIDLLERAYIPVYDYASGNTANQLAHITSNGAIVDLNLGLQNEFSRWSLAFDVKYIEEHNE